MKRLSKGEIERIRSSHDLLEVVRARGVRLQPKGQVFLGICPFHDDHDPSLVVNPEKQLWNCLGACAQKGGKTGGDVIEFVQKFDRITFPEALKRLQGNSFSPANSPVAVEEVGLSQVSPGPNSPLSRAKATFPVDRRHAVLGPVVDYYHRVFREVSEGQDYLKGRGLTDPSVLGAFRVGYVDGTLVKRLDTETKESLQALGVLNNRGTEMFYGCVVFPLELPDLGVVGLYGRQTKRDQHLYLPGHRRGIFHWQAMKGAQDVILTESILDALTLYQAGFRNVSAIYGVQGFTPDHQELLNRFRVRRASLCMDNDEAGRKATTRIGPLLREMGIDAYDVRLEGAKDPNELFAKLGGEAAEKAFRGQMAAARQSFEDSTSSVSPEDALGSAGRPPQLTDENLDVETPLAVTPPISDNRTEKSELSSAHSGERSNFPADLVPEISQEEGGGFWVKFPKRSYKVRGLAPTNWDRLHIMLQVVSGGEQLFLSRLDLYNEKAREHLLDKLVDRGGIERGDLFKELQALIGELERIRMDLKKRAASKAAPETVQMSDSDRMEALSFLKSPNLIARILEDFERVGFVGEKTGLTVGFLVGISRLLDKPLGLLIVSRSGAGKSTLQDLLCDFIPPEQLAKYTRVTPQALGYKEEHSLEHKVLAIDEEQGAEEAAYSIRNLQSAQVLRIAAPSSDPQTGKLRTEDHVVKGPVAIMFTTTSPEALDYETRNRFIQLGIDESTAQTRRILMRQREMETLEGLLQREEAQAIRRTHHNVQRLLRPLQVVIPFAKSLIYRDDLLQMRREQQKYLGLIKAVALLHQFQREVKRARQGEVEVEYVEATLEDLAVANHLAREVLGHSLEDLAPHTRQLLNHLVKLVAKKEDRTFTRREALQAEGWTDWTIRKPLEQLVDLEYVAVESGRKGQVKIYRVHFEGDPNRDTRFVLGLLDPEELTAQEDESERGEK